MSRVVFLFDVGETRHLCGDSALISWARENGIDPDLTYRVEVLADGDGQVIVYEYDVDERGYRFAPDGWPSRRDPYAIPLRTLPPKAA